jgi:hypothetical protein
MDYVTPEECGDRRDELEKLHYEIAKGIKEDIVEIKTYIKDVDKKRSDFEKITNKWIIGALAFLLIAAGGVVYANITTTSTISKMQVDRLEAREKRNQDIRSIDEKLNILLGKIK